MNVASAVAVLAVGSIATSVAAQPTPFDFTGVEIRGELRRPEVDLVSLPPWAPEPDRPLAPELANARTLLGRARDVLVAAFREAPTGARDPARRRAADEILRRARAEVRRLQTEAEVRISTLLDGPTSVLRGDAAVAIRWRMHLRALLHDDEGAAADAGRYVRECARCAGVADAWLIVARSAFDRQSLAEARDAFAHVETAPAVPADLAAYARYWIAWCQLNEVDLGGARASFEETIRRATALGPRGERLARQARRDLDQLADPAP